MNQWPSGGIEQAFVTSLQRRSPFPFLTDSSLMQRFAVEMPQQLGWTSCSDQLADPVDPLPPSGDDLKAPHKREHFSAALLQMMLCHCTMCRTPLYADDAHTECVSCLGKSHADTVLGGANSSHCESFCLASLRSRKAFISEKKKKEKKKSFLLWGGRKQLGRGFEQPVTSELTSAQCPHVSPSLQREHSSVLFTQHDQRSSAAVSNMISFCESDGEIDDSLSLVALVPRTPAQVHPGTGTSEVLLISQAERGGDWDSLPLDHPASSLQCASCYPARRWVQRKVCYWFPTDPH